MNNVVAAAIVGMLISTSAQAAELSVLRAEPMDSSEREVGCNFLLSGPIEAGDAEKLDAFYEAHEREHAIMDTGGGGFNLCLNSTGGSFEEGIALAKVMINRGLISYIRAEDQCLSACAIAFFGGTIAVDGRYKYRVAEPGATLGLHAPSLTLAGDTSALPAEISREIANAAYIGAIGNIQALAETLLAQQGTSPGMPVSLFVRMVSTPPNEFFYVETVGDYNRWDINVAGGEIDVLIDETTLKVACATLFNAVEHGDSFTEIFWYTPEDENVDLHLVRATHDDARADEAVWIVHDDYTYGLEDYGLRSNFCTFFIRNGTTAFGEGVRAIVSWANIDREQFYAEVRPMAALPASALISEIF